VSRAPDKKLPDGTGVVQFGPDGLAARVAEQEEGVGMGVSVEF